MLRSVNGLLMRSSKLGKGSFADAPHSPPAHEHMILSVYYDSSAVCRQLSLHAGNPRLQKCRVAAHQSPGAAAGGRSGRLQGSSTAGQAACQLTRLQNPQLRRMACRSVPTAPHRAMAGSNLLHWYHCLILLDAYQPVPGQSRSWFPGSLRTRRIHMRSGSCPASTICRAKTADNEQMQKQT